ncbi:MAG: segregation and condensation protein A [Pseudomonadota bacterium]|nr:segregation and condensation protein A [Pseudomonadota bacterium]
MSDTSTKERQILLLMRKVLANIIKDTTPEHRSMKHPLSDPTIQQVRECLGLISLRERELADDAGIQMEKPYFTDEKPVAEVIAFAPADAKSKKES